MVSKVLSLGLFGIQGYAVGVECFLSGGLPNFDVVGLPDAAIKESRDRVRAAIKNCGFDFPLRRITVNLAPADTRKEGSIYDLPIFLGILISANAIKPVGLDCAFIGELSLDGEVRQVVGVLPMAIAAQKAGVRELYVPAENSHEASLAGDIDVYAIKHVKELLEHLTGEKRLTPIEPFEPTCDAVSAPDFSEVMGQENVKRALEIAAAGGHNIMLLGSPGSGKSMLARRLPSILPDMTHDEALQVTELYSVSGMLSKESPYLSARPFRAPHHTISAIGLAGGGRIPRPGEISLAHNGVLFLDELPEFSRDALEILRQPLEDGFVTISRVAGSLTFPASFMLVSALNPCKCGWYGHPSGRCTCSRSMIDSYFGRISGPLLDRIDMHVEVPAVSYEDMSSRRPGEPSRDIKARVNRVRAVQNKRFEGTNVTCNAKMAPAMMKKYCDLDRDAEALMRDAFENLGLTGRSYDKLLRLARTIADMEESESIAAKHVAEAIQYRIMDRGASATNPRQQGYY